MIGETERDAEPRLSQKKVSATVISVALVAFGLFVAHQGYLIGQDQSSYARVGPQVFPYMVGAGLVIVGVLLSIDALKGTWPVMWAETADEHALSRPAYWRQLSNVGLVALGLVVNAFLIAPLGFVVSSTLMFALTTRAFGSRRIPFDLAVGAMFSGFIFLCFTYALGLPLPSGTIWGAR
ncbi:tripartite tricarboxylate transporter TctB family protein [Microvirga antarctica]|uniref:tripartite tricarboxylate transporter TctB family protein n=1 Tax=Microvirga antarctica TaxID=2819233 RepID=UPI001B309E30|nr:tripartite tricarboxylate transporter TctB family protein [Microvirga antarctica]